MRLNPEILRAVDNAAGAYKSASLAVNYAAISTVSEDELRSLIRDAADQLCRVVDGNLDFVVQVSRSDDDIDKLLLLVNFVLASARRSFNDLSEVHRRMEEDLLAARTLQERLLPETLPHARNLRVAAKCVPARTVGGDFYDFFRYPSSGLYVGLLGDVSGKGAAAAIYAGLASGVVRSLLDREMDPGAMLSRLNQGLFARAPEGKFIALAYATWDDEKRVLQICNSGLPEPLLCRKGSVQNLRIHGLPLGLFPHADYDVMRLECEPGDTLVFYTDGVVEEVDREGRDFSAEHLAEIVNNTCHLSVTEIVDHVFEQVSKHCSCQVNGDDQTVIAIKVE